MTFDSNTFADSTRYNTNNLYHLARILNRKILLGDLLIFWTSLSTIRLWYLNGRKQSIHQEIRSASPLQVLLEMAFHSFCCPCWLYDQVIKVEGSHKCVTKWLPHDFRRLSRRQYYHSVYASRLLPFESLNGCLQPLPGSCCISVFYHCVNQK